MLKTQSMASKTQNMASKNQSMASKNRNMASKNDKTMPEDRSLKFAGIRTFKLKIVFKQLKTDTRL